MDQATKELSNYDFYSEQSYSLKWGGESRDYEELPCLIWRAKVSQGKRNYSYGAQISASATLTNGGKVKAKDLPSRVVKHHIDLHTTRIEKINETIEELEFERSSREKMIADLSGFPSEYFDEKVKQESKQYWEERNK